MNTQDWVELARDADTGIETIRAHFEGHAYDPHWHDSYLVGVTERGVQQFHCRRTRHRSTTGGVILIEPGEIHDGEAPAPGGFSYRMLYLDPHWLDRELRQLFEQAPDRAQLRFDRTLVNDEKLAIAIDQAFRSLHGSDIRIARQAATDQLLTGMTAHLRWRSAADASVVRLPQVAQQARDYLHAHMPEDIGLDDLARLAGIDRFRLSRAFKAAFGMAPHAYLIQLRLARARQLLASGESPANTAAAVGFADQSHLGRWFSRAYRLTPADYRRRCGGLSGR
ncbi:MAG TPA: AraC family transcriptional regulator [Luteibacter sp.]|nr:AraC family transcriptional regulator [Luteibacter sp.]